MNYIKTTEKVEVEDYPYGFRLRTTLFDTIDFNPKKGYRHTTQTIDPRNGRLNKPKSSTYSPLKVRYYDENGHIKTITLEFMYSAKDLNKACKFINENFELFTPEEIQYFYDQALVGAVVNVRAMVQWGGADLDAVKPLHDGFIAIAKKGKEDGLNHFGELVLDVDAIEALKDPNYQPFRVKQTCTIG